MSTQQHDASRHPLTMSSREVYAALGVSRTAFYEALRRDDLPIRPIRVGRAVRFSRAAVMALLEPQPHPDTLPDERLLAGNGD